MKWLGIKLVWKFQFIHNITSQHRSVSIKWIHVHLHVYSHVCVPVLRLGNLLCNHSVTFSADIRKQYIINATWWNCAIRHSWPWPTIFCRTNGHITKFTFLHFYFHLPNAHLRTNASAESHMQLNFSYEAFVAQGAFWNCAQQHFLTSQFN